MPVSVIQGINGSIVLSASDTQFYASFTITGGADLIDVSHYGDTYRTRVSGLKDWAGTATAFVTKGASAQNPFVAGTTGTATITFDSGVTASFSCVIGNVTLAGEVGGVNVVTFTWSHSGSTAPTITWA